MAAYKATEVTLTSLKLLYVGHQPVARTICGAVATKTGRECMQAANGGLAQQ